MLWVFMQACLTSQSNAENELWEFLNLKFVVPGSFLKLPIRIQSAQSQKQCNNSCEHTLALSVHTSDTTRSYKVRPLQETGETSY